MPAITQALRAAGRSMLTAGREWAQCLHTDAVTALARLNGEARIAIIGDYLVAYQIIEPWFMRDARIFSEVLVLRISQTTGNSLRNVLREMERIARANNCAGMHLGTFGDSTGKLVRVYERLGLTPAPANFYKEL